MLCKAVKGNKDDVQDGFGKLADALVPPSLRRTDDLLSVYDPEVRKIVDELNIRANSQPFIVFTKQGNVNIDKSMHLLRLIRKGAPATEWLEIEDKSRGEEG